jgi:hypothetical protein
MWLKTSLASLSQNFLTRQRGNETCLSTLDINAAGNVFAVSVVRSRCRSGTASGSGAALEDVLDDVAILVEALRRTQAKAAFYLEPGRDRHKGLREICAILEEERLGCALERNSKVTLVPDERDEEVVPAAPLSR